MPCHPMCGTCKGTNRKYRTLKKTSKLICSVSGPLEDECQTCAEGFVFDNVKKKCASTCPNGNFFDKDTKVSVPSGIQTTH